MRSTQELIAEYLDIHAQRRKILTTIAIIAIVVALVVASLTISPAITMQGDNETICGLEEHTHTDDCYTKKLICDIPEAEAHHHGETCYEKRLICENTDEDHIHTDECYETALICGAEETDGHIHTDECYEYELTCGLPEHTHTAECYPEDIAVPIENLVLEGTCFEAVYSVDELADSTASYLIVSPEENSAVYLNDNLIKLTKLSISPILGNENAYEIKSSSKEVSSDKKAVNDLKWSIVAGENGATIRNAADGRYYLSLTNSNISSKESSTVSLNLGKQTNTWQITQKIDGVVHYLTYTENGIINSNDASAGDSQWQIFKLSDKKLNKKSILSSLMSNDTKNTFASDLVRKSASQQTSAKKAAAQKAAASNAETALAAENDSYITPSDKVEGTIIGNDALWEYASDPATSQIESQFDGVQTDDGKVLADKSVIYGDDDYDAFDDYGFGTFGVELSALAQQYNLRRFETRDEPVDVVFIIDTSGSMTANTKDANGNNIMRMQALVNAINPAINQIIKANPENRIGVVNYSNGSGVLVPLDYYNLKRNENYFTFERVAYNSDYTNNPFKVSVNMTSTSGNRVTNSTSEMRGDPDGNGTYTQHGIARANEMFQAAETTYNDKNGNPQARRPIIIQISDGDPTFSTYNYTDVLNGPHYGNTSTKAAHGYYTILSALYYKQQVTEHYNNTASYYTIGIGIDPSNTGTLTGVQASHKYVTAILNPTEKNLVAATESENSYYNITAVPMYQMLKNQYTGSSFYVGGGSYLGGTSSYIPINKNNYDSFGYADDAYFGEMTENELKEVFDNIIQSIVERVEYGFNLKESTKVNLTDPIGNGMEVKGDPVLRYYGQNYKFTKKENSTNANGDQVVKYIYSYTVVDENITDIDNNVRTVDLSKIEVTVVTDTEGKQTVSLDIPEDCIPVYSPDLQTRVYSEELPVRLIYQVGLTETAIQNASDGDVFYTNRWQNGDSAGASFYPHTINPYYEKDVGRFKDNQTAKTDNTTSTNNNSSQYSANDDNTEISVQLGNNGKLVYVQDKSTISVEANKKWIDENGDEITDKTDLPDVKFTLYRVPDRDGAEEELVETVTVGNANNWKYTWPDLPVSKDGVSYIYSVRERTPDGYYSSTSGTVENGDGTITVTNTVIPDEGALIVKKKWLNIIENEIENTSQMPDIEVELWRHVQSETKASEPVTVTIKADGGYFTLGTYKVAKGTNMSFKARASYYDIDCLNRNTFNINSTPVETIVDDAANLTIITKNAYTIQVNSNMTININFDTTGGYADYPDEVELVDLNYTEAGSSTGGGTQQLDDEFVQKVTLNNKNNWQYLFDNLEMTKNKGTTTYTYSYFVKEISEIPGYTTSYSDGNTEGIHKGEVIITNKANTAMDILPETGSTGTGGYILGGLALAIFAGAGMCAKWCIKRKRLHG